MKRLTTKNSMGVAVYKTPYECDNCNEPIYRLPDYGNGSPTDRLAEYEDAEEQGFLLKLPCKVGTHIYIINHYWIDEGHICGLAECDDVDCACFKVYEDPDTYTMVAFNEFGQTWFLTEEEAEQKLKELQG